jgi:hypothetical protein
MEVATMAKRSKVARSSENVWSELDKLSELELWQHIAQCTSSAGGIRRDRRHSLDSVLVDDDGAELGTVGSLMNWMELEVNVALVLALKKRFPEVSIEDDEGDSQLMWLTAPLHLVRRGSEPEGRPALSR